MNGTEPTVRKEITVACDVDDAFRAFSEEIGEWWPFATHSVFGDEAVSAVMEPVAGGRIYEVAADGRRAEWGVVLEIEVPRRVRVAWHPGSDPSSATTWEAGFENAGSGATRITLVHGGFERRGDEADRIRSEYTTGWDYVLGELARHTG